MQEWIKEALRRLPRKVFLIPVLALGYLFRGLFEQWLFDSISTKLSQWEAPMWLINVIAQNTNLTSLFVFLLAMSIVVLWVIWDINHKTRSLYNILSLLKKHQKISYRIGKSLKKLDVTQIINLAQKGAANMPLTKDVTLKLDTDMNIDTLKKRLQGAADAVEKERKVTGKNPIINELLEKNASMINAGFNLDVEKEKHSAYLQVKNDIEDYYDSCGYAVNKELDELIQAHMRLADVAVLGIFLERFSPFSELIQYTSPTQLQTDVIEGTERSSGKAMRKQRVKIMECIQKIEKELADRKPKK